MKKPKKEEVVPNRNKRSMNSQKNKRTTIGGGNVGKGYVPMGSAKK